MTDPTEKLNEEEQAELEAKLAMRRMMRKAGIVCGMAFLVGVVFMATLQSVVAGGMTRGAMLAPIGIYLLLGLAITRRGHWALSGFCLAGLILHLTVIQESAKTLAVKRESRTKASLQKIRTDLSAFEDANGRFPASLKELPEAGLSPLICSGGRSRQLEIAPASRANTGGWVYDPATGIVSVDCEMTESSGKRWSEL